MNEQRTILNDALRTASTTREVVLATAAIGALPDVWRRRVPLAPALVVADATTHAVAGIEALARLREAGIECAEPIVLAVAPRLKPRVDIAMDIGRRVRDAKAVPVAVGSGVVNDLVKYGAEIAGTPYVCIATAASMDGYAASGAALNDGGFKRTFACAAPIAILADLDVLANAPSAMAGWGYGDLSGKVVAGADWMLADALGIEPIAAAPFAQVQDHLPGWLAEPERIASGDPGAFERLLCGLLVSGLAMQAHGNSRPASGSDHQFAHLWEMEGVSFAGEPVSHGACVGIGCVAMLALYEWLCAQRIDGDVVGSVPNPEDLAAQQETEITRSFASGMLIDSARVEMRHKRESGDRRARLLRVAQVWPLLRSRLLQRLPSARAMQARLRALDAPAHPADLGIAMDAFAGDHRRARLIRRRYTILDLVDDLGWLDRAVDALFAVDGFWGRQCTYPVRISAGDDVA